VIKPRLDDLIRLYAGKVKAQWIADEAGVALGSVYTRASQLRISLRPRREETAGVDAVTKFLGRSA
jgi:hypothetical protein